MKDIITDLAYIQNSSLQSGSLFKEFRANAKKISLRHFDELAAPLVEEITQKINCTQCGNCCKMQEPGITEEEIGKLADLKKMNAADFKTSFVSYDHQQVSFLCKQPCIFLDETVCSVYTHRPNSCADFPGLHRPGLKWRINQMEENYGICPIVFNVVEKLKNIISV
jgi:Fe-S-cluster containining protein